MNPFLPRSGSNVETVYKNYEMLVTRLCSLESTIQSLKLKLASKEAMRECKECFKKVEQINHLNEAFANDLQAERSKAVHAKGEIQNERVLRQSAEIRVKHAESMLDSNSKDKAELSEKLSSMNEVSLFVLLLEKFFLFPPILPSPASTTVHDSLCVQTLTDRPTDKCNTANLRYDGIIKPPG